MSEKFNGLSDEAKLVAWSIGYVGVTIVLCYWMYKAVAVMFGRAVVAELIKAGVVTVL